MKRLNVTFDAILCSDGNQCIYSKFDAKFDGLWNGCIDDVCFDGFKLGVSDLLNYQLYFNGINDGVLTS